MWNTEKEFGKCVMAALKLAGYSCMRIESASTITGCPDLWVQGKGNDYFIELKNVKVQERPAECDMNTAAPLRVSWRQGQQGWAIQYAKAHQKVLDTVIRCKYSWTFVGMRNCVVAIRMRHTFNSNLVEWNDPDVFVLKKANELSRLLEVHTHDVIPTNNVHTKEEACYNYACEFARLYRPDTFEQLDIPAGSDMIGMSMPDIRELIYNLCSR